MGFLPVQPRGEPGGGRAPSHPGRTAHGPRDTCGRLAGRCWVGSGICPAGAGPAGQLPLSLVPRGGLASRAHASPGCRPGPAGLGPGASAAELTEGRLRDETSEFHAQHLKCLLMSPGN